MPNFSAWMGGEGQPDAIAEIIGFKSVSTGTPRARNSFCGQICP